MNREAWGYAERQARLDAANSIITEIAGCGRKFFLHDGEVSRIEMDERGRLWFVDSYKGYRTYLHYAGRWRKFHHGGTLESLIKSLRDFIMLGKTLPLGTFGPWHDWVSGGDLWGYGKDNMVSVRAKALGLGLLEGAND
jgi:hypothetical protein